ncbi:MAG: choice-of-anchor D domain-containing protein, partial [Terracidiphilus sp.]
MKKLQNAVLVSLTAMFCLFSTAFAAAQTTISATAVNFGSVVVNTTSSTRTVTLKNTGAASITISSLSVTAGTPYGIAATSTCLNPTLAAGASCTVGLTLSPTTTGAQSAGTLTINTTASNPTTTVSLSGTGVAPVTLTATGFGFGNQIVNTTSSTKSLGVINYMSTPLSISSISASAGFNVVPGGSCSTTSTVATGANCNILIDFAPTTPGAQTGTLTIVSNSPTSPQSVSLSGTGVPPVALTMTAINFGTLLINTTSSTKSLGVINYMSTPLSISSISASAGFNVVPGGSCSTTATVATGANCNILVDFAPTTPGAQTGTLTIASNAPGSLMVPLSGTGVAPVTLTMTAINFGTLLINTTSSTRSLGVINYMSTPLSISSIIASAGFNVVPGGSCSTTSTVATGTNCNILVDFAPTMPGAQTGTLTIASNAPGSLTVPLSGTGVAPTALSTSSIGFGNVPINTTSAAQTVGLINYYPGLSISSITPSAGFSVVAGGTCSTTGTMAASTTCSINVAFEPTAFGAQTGTLTIASNAPAPYNTQTVALSGTGVAPTVLSTSSMGFVNVPINTTSTAQVVGLTNFLPGLSISSITASAGFTVVSAGTTCSTTGTMAVNTNCHISVAFAPTATGLQTGTLTIFSNSPNSPQSVSLSGTGILPVVLTATGFGFGDVPVNTTSLTKSLGVINYMATPLSISSISASAGFSVVPGGSCSTTSTVATGANCNILVAFAPTTLGAQTGTLTIASNSPSSPQSIALSGTGVAPVTLTPSSVGFGSFAVGATSTAKSLTLTNYQSGALTITSALFGGPFVLDTGVVTTCPVSGGVVSGSLAGNSSCVIGVDFQPTATGPAVGGQITVIDAASNSPQVATLTGTGDLPVAVSPGTLAFGNVQTGTTSAAKNVTVTNNQPVNLDFTSITVPTPYAIAAGTTTCVVGTPVLPGTNCVISVTYSPTTLGATPASELTITDDAASSPQTVKLTGTGVGQVTLSPTTLAFGTVVVNNPVAKTVTLTNNQGSSLTITSITGLPAAYTQSSVANSCTPGLVVVSGGNCVITLSLTATTTGAQPGTISVNDDATTSPQSFTVSANAIAPVVLSPSSLTFAAQQVGTTSTPAKTVTLTNEQIVVLNISGVTITGPNSSDFNVTTTCPLVPASLAASGNCPLQVTFTPSASGVRTATLNVNDDAPGSPQTIPLTGSGSAPVTVLPGLLTFTAPVGSTSAYQTVTIANASSGSVQFTSLLLSGDFIQTSTSCGTLPFTLAAGANCRVSLEFNPSIGGTRDGQLQVYDTAPTSPQVINLTGTGTSPLTLSVSSLSFSAQTVNTSSPAKVITLTNHETESETFSLGTTGDFSATSNCGTGTMPIAANSSCLVFVIFTPSSVLPSTTRNGTLTVTDTAPGGPAPSASLTGSAIATNPPAAVSVVAPGAGAAGTSVNVVITGNGWTHFSPSSVISFTDVNSGTYPVDITVTSQTFISVNQINATFTIPANTVGNPVTYGARNIAVTTPLSGGGNEVAQLEQAFIIADPNNAHPITAVAPAFGTQGQTLNVDLTATGTNFDQGVTYANFGDGVTVNYLTVTDATDAQANITISNTTNVGSRTITLVTGGEFAVSTSGVFQIGPNNATLTGFTVATYSSATSSYTCTATPAVEPQGWSGALCMTANGTHFLQDATQVSFTGGILVGDVTVTSPTTAIVQVAVQALATIGLQNATVWTGGETATLNNAFAVTGATPLLLSVVPSSAPQGSSPTVVITANSYMNFVSGQVSATFDGNISSPTVNVIDGQHVSIPISITTDANVGSITANLIVGPSGSTVLYPFTFTVTQSSAAITSVSPSCVPQGGQLTLTVAAINTNWVQGTTTAAFYPVPVPAPSFDLINIIDPTDATLNVAVPTNTPAGNYEFYMATGGQIVNASMKVCAATPTLTMNPPNGLRPYGAAVNSFSANFTGQFSHFGPTTEAVISGEGVTLTNFNVTGVTSATATVTIIANVNGTPTALGPRKITLTTGGEIVTTYFNVTQTPVGILSISPYHGPQSTTMNVEIVGLNTHFTQPTTTVQFGPQITVNGVTVNSNTDLIANITTSYNDGGVLATPPGWQSVYVNSAAGTGFTTAAGLPTTTSGAGTGAVVSITASATGALTSCTATSGGSGYQVGDYVYPTQAGSAGSACQVTAVDGTTAITTMITVQEQEITGFLVDSPALPSLVSVCVTGTGPYSTSTVPCVSSAQQGATVGVTITGSLTNWVQGTTEAILGAGVSIGDLTITSPTTATATIAVSPTAPVGGNSVIMFTGSELVSGTGFSVTPGASLIYSVGPVGCNANAITIADVCGVSNGAGTPYVVTQLQTATLNIVGVGTHWLQGETTASFGAGVATDSLTITSPTTATAQITVLSTSPVGFAALTMTTDGEVTTLQQAIDIEEGFPILLATSPSGGEQGNNITLQVLGRFANWQQGVTSAAFNNNDITVNSVTVIDSNNLQLAITVTPWAYVDYSSPCGHVLTVTTGTEQEAGSINHNDAGLFCVSQGAEEITAVSPLAGIQGMTESVTITGAATNFIAGVTQVSFGDPNFQVGEIQVNSATSLTVPVAITTSASTGFKTITVSTYGQVASQQYGFTVYPGVATLNEAIPNQAEQGAPIVTSPTCSTLPYCMVRLLGQYSHFSDLSTATFGAGITVNSVSYVSDTEVDAYISIDPLSYPGGRTVTVTTPGVSCAFQPPIATNDVTYSGCTPGVSTGTGSEIVTANIFSIIPGPAIISNVAPNTGNEGQEVVFNITGEATHWAQNFTQFYIGGQGSDITVNSVVINSPTSATADISISPTANPGPRSVSMVTDGEVTVDRGAFVVTGGIPVISYITPNSSLYGTNGVEVTVVGNAYTEWNASSTVSFGPGITVNSFQVDDTSHIEAVLNIGPNCTSPGVPSGCAQLGYHTVIVQTGAQVLTSNFQVTAPAPPPTPYIWYESPWSGLPGQTFTITFYGLYTNWDIGPGEACSQSGTTLTGFNAAVTVNCFQVLSPNSATANITISPTATASVSDLTLTTNLVGGGQEVDTAQFSVVVSVPTLTVVDPGSSMQGTENLTVNILGNYTTFDSTTTFNFGEGITTNGPPTILGPGIATQSISIAQLANLGGRSVVATTPDATLASAQVVGGAGFTVTPSLALISAVTPNTALQGQTPQVEVTGQNTHWSGSTIFQFGDGIVVTKYTVNSATDATVWLAIPAYAGEGPTWATATTQGEVATLNNAFVVQAGTPYLLSSGPGSVPQQSSAVFTILSQATQWLTNPPTVSYGDGVVLTNVNVTGNTSLTVDGYIQPTTYTGYRNLTVTSGTQVLGLNNVLYIRPGPAVINDVVANTTGQGATVTVTINGTNTHWQQGVTTLTFPNVLINGTPTVNSPTSISVNITVNDSAPAGEESITATTLGEVATGVNVFTITQTQPELLAVVPSSQVQGWTGNVNLTGQFTSFNTAAGCSPNCTTANFGSGITVNSVTATDSSHATANITVSPTTTLGYRNVTVTTGTEVVSLNNSFRVTVGPAAIVSALSPDSGAQNQSYNVLVVGSQTHFLQGTTTANFGPYIQVTGVTVTDTLHATVAITIPASTPLNTYDVSLTTGGEVATQLGAFTVTTGSPVLTVVNPPTGHQGDPTFTVNLTGLFTHFNTAAGCSPNCSTASFGAGITVGPVTATSLTQASVPVTISPSATIGSRNVTVTTGSETASITGGFSVLAGVPAVITAAPSSGQAGTTTSVVITGQFTTFQAGFSTVSMGSGITVNFITGVTLTQLTANITIASNATVGNRDVSVTTNGTTLTLSNGFAVTAGTQVITGISPNFGNPGQTGLTMTITGQYTNWTTASTVTIGTAADGITVLGAAGPGLPGPVITATPTSITVSVSIAAGAPVGPAGVTVTTGVSSQNVAGGFTVQAVVIPAPSILSISPGMNAGNVLRRDTSCDRNARRADWSARGDAHANRNAGWSSR